METQTRQRNQQTDAEMKAEIIAAHDKLEQLELSGRFAEADAFFHDNRAIFNYDRAGKWVGGVFNENGWSE